MSVPADTRLVRLLALAALVAAAGWVASLSPRPAQAAPVTRTWTGLGANNSWTTAANWAAGPPVAGDRLVFPNAANRKANSNDFANFTAFESITLEGAGYTLSGNRISITDEVFNSGNGVNTIALILDGPGAVRQTAGTLNLLGANSHAGANVVIGGTLHAGHNNAFGELPSLVDVFQGTVTLASGVVVLNPLIIGGPTVPELIGAGDSGWAGSIELAGDASFEAGPGVTFELSGEIKGASGFVKGGPGEVVLSEANTFAGEVLVSLGRLRIVHDDALGSPAAGTRVTDGGTLILDGADAYDEPLRIAGDGFASLGALRSTGGIVHADHLTATGQAVIRVDDGVLRLSNGLDHEPAATMVVKTGPGSLEVEGAGSFAGSLIVQGGELAVRGDLAAGVQVVSGLLSGDGSIGRLDVLAGSVAPGVDGGGVLRVNGIAYLGSQSTASFTVDAPNSYTILSVAGTVILDNGTVEVGGDGIVPPGTDINLIVNDSGLPVTGMFNGRQDGDTVVVNGHDFRLTYLGGDDDNTVQLRSIDGLPESVTVIEAVPGTPTVPSGGEAEFRFIAFNDSGGPVSNAQIRIEIAAGALFESLISEPGWSCVTPPVQQSGMVVCTHASWAQTGFVEFALFAVKVTVVGAQGEAVTIRASLAHSGVEGDESDNAVVREVPIGSSDPLPFKLRVPWAARDGSN